MPYSVSMPMTFGMAMRPLYEARVKQSLKKNPGRGGRGAASEAPGALSYNKQGQAPGASYFLEVLSGIDDLFDVALLFLRLAHERLHVPDPLALLAGDLRPVVGVGRVRQILVLLELLAYGGEQVVGHDALLTLADVALERQLLGAPDDRLDHGARGEVLEVQDLLVPVGVGDLQEAVLLAQAVHRLDGREDHRVDGGLRVPAVLLRLGRRDGDLRRHVLLEDVIGRLLVRPLDLDLHVQAAGPQDGRVDQILPVGGADHDDVLQSLDAVDLGQQLRHDRRLDVGRDAGAARAEQGVHLVEKDDDRDIFVGLLFGFDEDLPDLALGLADVLVQQLGALDVQEEALDLLAALLGDLLGQVIGHGLGDHGLAAAGRAVE